MQVRKAVALLGAAGLVAAGIALATPAQPAQAAAALPLVAIGIPDFDVGSATNAGAVEVRNRSGVVQRLTAPGYQAGDRFGAVTATGDLTGDGRADLIVGAPGRDLYGTVDAGAAYLFRGTAGGFQFWRILGQGYAGVPGRAQAGAALGASIAYDPARWDHPNRLYLGAPFTDVGDATDAGAVVELDFTPAAPNPTISGRVLTESSFPQWGEPAAGERFGQAVAAGTYLSIGAPGETVNGQVSAGAVFHRRGGGEQDEYLVLTQDFEFGQQVPGAAEAGDEFGRALLDLSGHLWVGVPGEDIGTVVNAGMVNHFTAGMMGEIDIAEGLSQNSYDPIARRQVAGNAEAGDRFGASLTAYWHDIVNHPWVYVGAPGEDIGSAVDAGMVCSLYSRGNQDVPYFSDAGLGGTNERGDKFGASVSAVLLSQEESPITYGLVIGIPGENGYGVAKVTGPFRATWRLASPKAGDGYGSSVRIAG